MDCTYIHSCNCEVVICYHFLFTARMDCNASLTQWWRNVMLSAMLVYTKGAHWHQVVKWQLSTAYQATASVLYVVIPHSALPYWCRETIISDIIHYVYPSLFTLSNQLLLCYSGLLSLGEIHTKTSSTLNNLYSYKEIYMHTRIMAFY